MIKINLVGLEKIDAIIEIYNNANLLFDSTERADGEKDYFTEIFDNEIVYILYYDSFPVGFMSYFMYHDYAEMTALYLKKDYQNMGLGFMLLSYFEDLVTHQTNYLIIRALNNATWALNFYIKYGYKPIDEECMRKLGITSEKWSTVLLKEIINDK